MGSSSSDTSSYSFINLFEELVAFADKQRISNKAIQNNLKILSQKTEEFFQYFDVCVEKQTLDKDIGPYFSKIEQAINSFRKCTQYICEKQYIVDVKPIIKVFQQDFNSFIDQLINLENCTISIVQKLRSYSPPKLMTRFYIELSIFDFALNVKSLEVPPYYHLSTLPAYMLHDQVENVSKRCMSIIGPHGTGKTALIPMFLACNLLSQAIKSQASKTKQIKISFIVVVENDTTLIHGIEKCYNQIKKNKAIPIYDEAFGGADAEADFDDDEENNDEYNYLIVTSSFQNVLELFREKSLDFVVIAILSPLEVLQLVHKEETFVSKSSFIFDDLNQRTIEMDVLFQDISRKMDSMNRSNNISKITLLSTIADRRFLLSIGHYENCQVILPEKKPVERKIIQCQSIREIGKRYIIREMCRFFDNWVSEEQYPIGSIIAFVPKTKTVKNILKGLSKYYSNEDSNKIYILHSKIKKGESVEHFNEKLLTEIEVAATEKLENPDLPLDSKDTIFLLPIDMTGAITEEEKNLIEAQLPLPFIQRKLVRLIFTSNKNEAFMKVPDLTVIFDSGITETEHYNIEKEISYFVEEMLPEPFIDQRNKLLGDTENNVHFIFNVKNAERPKDILPPVKRINMTQSILRLRNIGIKLEDQRNLPNEPDHTILDAGVALLKSIGIIDPHSKELTEIGKVASKFSSVSPFFALATAKFTENQTFAFLVSLVIERFVDLVQNDQSKLLYDHFCSESDVVTILESILALNVDGETLIEENAINFDDSGFSIGTLYSIYTTMANTFEKKDKNEGRQLVVSSIQWAQKQPGNTLGMVDKYVNLLDQNKFLDLRKGTFQYVVGTGPGCEPTLVYKANDIFKFDKDKDAHVKFAHRPGWLGLQSPGNIIILSLQVEESSKLNRGLVIHRDPSQIGVNPGVISQVEANPSLNSCFFTALFEAYWSGNPMVDNFIGIYHTNKPKKESAFLINICECNNTTYLNYCPKSADVKNEMNQAIPLLSALMPYVPRSIVVKSEAPSCAVEVITYGTSEKYESRLFQIENPAKKNPFAYPINKALLEYARNNIEELKKTFPAIRFSITGESIYYKFVNNRQLDVDFSYPNADPNIKAVFDPSKASQLVFLVDNEFPNKPGIPPIPWLAAADAGVGTIESNDTKEIDLIVNTASKILNGLGFAKRSEDIFYITLDGAYPRANEGEIPESIQNKVGFCPGEQGAIKQGVDQLVRQYTKLIATDKNLERTNIFEQFSSTNQCTRYTTPEAQTNLLNQVNAAISAQLHLAKDDVDSIFIGPSMISIRIGNLPPNTTSHPKSKDISNDAYLPCEADNTIGNILRTLGIPVTTVVHEPTVTLTIFHLRRLRLDRKQFEDKINSITKKFGFFLASIPEYEEEENFDAESGVRTINCKMSFALIGKSTSVEFASYISNEFPIVSGDFDENGFGMTMTMTMFTKTTMHSLHDLDPRIDYPKYIPFDKMVMRVPEGEIDAMKDLIKHNADLKFDEKYRILIFPEENEKEVQKLLMNVRSEKMEAACFMACGFDEPDLLPQCIYANEKDGSVRPVGICKGCMLSNFEYNASIKSIFNPTTNMIDQAKLKKIPEPLTGFPTLGDTKDENNDFWPQIPFGQLIWALMSDLTGELQPYIRAWFTIIVEFTIQNSKNYIFCPNHPDIAIPLPEENKKVKCPYCDMIFCDTCLVWHPLDHVCEGLPPGIKCCPWCHLPGIKVSGCNRITCPKCNNSWCYQCLQGFRTIDECYAHINALKHYE